MNAILFTFLFDKNVEKLQVLAFVAALRTLENALGSGNDTCTSVKKTSSGTRCLQFKFLQ